MESQAKHEIKKFLERVEEKLPGWLRDNDREKNDIIKEMEEHIWDKAEEIARGDDIDLRHVQQAILSMGSPTDIAKEFRKRGTPKIYISEEWFPWYLKVMKIVLIVIGCFSIIPMFFSIGKATFWDILVDLFQNIWGGLLFGVVIVSLIFTALSMNGYLPQDFKDAIEKEDVNLKIFGIDVVTHHDKEKCGSVYNRDELRREKYEETYNRAMGVKNDAKYKSEYEPKYQSVPKASTLEYPDEDEEETKDQEGQATN